MSGYLYKDFISYLYNNPLIILIYSLVISFIVLFINKVKLVLYVIVSLIILSLYCCLYTDNLLCFLLGIEGYNLLYLLLNYNTSNNYYLLISLRKLALLSMVISGIIIFGTTLVFLANDSLYFNYINIYNTFSKLGLGFILIGILFKLCVVPFHIWILDIYKNSPYYIVLITDCLFKVILLQILLKFISIFPVNNFSNIFLILGIISMFLGIILSMKESNIKRFLGLFSISHIGLILLILSINNNTVYKSVLGYLLMYSTCSLCFILAIKDNIKDFRDLKNNYINKININNNIALAAIPSNKPSVNNNLKPSVNNNLRKRNLIVIIASLLAIICIPPFHTFLAKVDLILVILENSKYTVLILSTMYFILEIIVIIIKMRFFKNRN